MLDLPMLTRTTLEKINRGEIEVNNENSKVIESIEGLRHDLRITYMLIVYLLIGIGGYLLHTSGNISQPVFIGIAVVLLLHYIYMLLRRR